MAEGKKGVLIYSDWIKKFEALEDDEAGRLIKHFFRYVNDLNPIAPDRITQLSFIDIESSLKRDLKKWEERAERSRENGKSGGRPPNKIDNLEKPTETQQVILKPEKPVSVIGIVNVIVKGKEKKEVVDKEAEFFRDNFKSHHLNRSLIETQKIPPEKIAILIEIFIDQKIGFDELKGKDFNDLCKNFYYWVPKYLKANKEEKQNGYKKSGSALKPPGIEPAKNISDYGKL